MGLTGENTTTVDAVVEDREISKVQLSALRDQRLDLVEDCARAYSHAMLAADRASRELTSALLAAEELNQMSARAVSDQVLADAVNRGIPERGSAFGRPLRMSLMAVRRRTGKATDSRRARKR